MINILFLIYSISGFLLSLILLYKAIFQKEEFELYKSICIKNNASFILTLTIVILCPILNTQTVIGEIINSFKN